MNFQYPIFGYSVSTAFWREAMFIIGFQWSQMTDCVIKYTNDSIDKVYCGLKYT